MVWATLSETLPAHVYYSLLRTAQWSCAGVNSNLYLYICSYTDPQTWGTFSVTSCGTTLG